MSQEKGYIEKKKTGTGLYQELFQEGIDILQKISGNVWTDYNIHDPGVTLLENIIYSLTELSYKSDFEIQDLLLRDKRETLKSGDNGLFVCSDILTTNPITINDLRKLIVDQVKNVKNVWIEPLLNKVDFRGQKETTKNVRGLYIIALEMENVPNNDFEQKKRELIDEVERVFYQHRNICEYLYDIYVLEPFELGFKLDVTIENTSNGESVLAQVINEMNHFLIQEVEFKSLWELEDEGLQTNEIFNGPYLNNGFILDESLSDFNTEVQVIDIINLIGSVEGVVNVNSFHFLTKPHGSDSSFEILQEGILSIPKDHFPSLGIPQEPNNIIFRSSGLKYIGDIEEIKNEIAYLDSMKYGSVQSSNKVSNKIDIPKGEFINVKDYLPIRFQLPDVYGVGENGLISGLDKKRYAQAKQLKAFLMPIDQIMTNMLGLMVHLNDLYDVKDDNLASYFSVPLPDMEHLIELVDLPSNKSNKDNLKLWQKKLIGLDVKFDTDSNSRLQRITDDLLSRFSETYPDYSLSKTYAHIYPYLDSNEIESRILKAKRNYVRNYHNISYQRSKACDYFELSKAISNELKGEEIESMLPGVLRKIASLVNIVDYSPRYLTKELESSNLVFFTENDNVVDVIDELKNEELNRQLDIQDYKPINKSETSIESDFFFQGSQDDLLNQVLRFGIHSDNYSVKFFKKERKSIAQVWLNTDENKYVTHVAKSVKSAEKNIENCTEQLQIVNENSEGIFLVEHIVLMPDYKEKNFGYVFPLNIIDKGINLTIKHFEKKTISERDQDVNKLIQGFLSKTLNLGVNSEEGKYFMEATIGQEKIGISEETFAENELDDLCRQIDLVFQRIARISSQQKDLIINSVQNWSYFNNKGVNESFFSLKMTFLLPSWPARFQDRNFKESLGNIIYDVLPIHLVAETRMLSLNQMRSFEKIYFDWLKAFDKKSNPELTYQLIRIIQELSNE